MARWLPPHSPAEAARPLGHDAVALSLFAVACVAAAAAVVSSMCASCHLRPRPRGGGGSTGKAGAAAGEEQAESQKPRYDDDGRDGDGSNGKTVIELSPEVATHGPIAPVALPASASKRRLSMNLSMTIPDKMRLSRRERKEKVESDETLWKKAIILGEKCKVPGGGDGGGGGDGDDDDEESMASCRFSNFSRPMSRSTSFVIHDPAHS